VSGEALLTFRACDERILTDESGEEVSVIGEIVISRLVDGYKRDRVLEGQVVGLVIWPRGTHAADVQVGFMKLLGSESDAY
jgi:hypothetical protein